MIVPVPQTFLLIKKKSLLNEYAWQKLPGLNKLNS